MERKTIFYSPKVVIAELEELLAESRQMQESVIEDMRDDGKDILYFTKQCRFGGKYAEYLKKASARRLDSISFLFRLMENNIGTEAFIEEVKRDG